MRLHSALVVFVSAVTLAAGCIAEDFADGRPADQRPDAGADAQPDARTDTDADTDADTETDTGSSDPCSGACSGESTMCDESTGKCVECLADDDCDNHEKPVCGENRECVGCKERSDCVDFEEETPACNNDTGECVECTVHDEEFCEGNSCDPATNKCTDNETGETGLCGECSADSECTGNLECVPAQFQGQELDKAYCIVRSQGGCDDESYPEEVTRTSLSRENEDTYCTVNEDFTTCKASNDLQTHRDCDANDECGYEDLDDAYCFETNEDGSGVCTIPCKDDQECSRGHCGEDESISEDVCIDD
ncbi:MAG: hypothetical protein ACOCV2_08115 [Persicimonas sp.]